MEYIIIISYVILIIWMLPKISLVKHADLSVMEMRLLLVFKIIVGIATAYYFKEIAGATDYLAYNDEGQTQYELLLSKPAIYFKDITADIQTYGFGGLFESSYSLWANLKSNLLFKFLGVLNVFTGGNFYLNTIVFCSLVFFGHLAFYRIYSNIYKGKKLLLLFACFCMPSVLFYTSCVHKDGIIFLNLGIISYIFYTYLTTQKRVRFIHIFLFCLGILVIFLFRNYLLVALVPAMAAALIIKMLKSHKTAAFILTYSSFFALFFLSGLSQSPLNLPAAVVKRKADFALLGEATTNVPMKELYPTLKSFIVNLPQAINHSLLRPYLWEFSNPAIILTALELLLYQLIAVMWLFFRRKQADMVTTFNVFGIAFFSSMMLIIGYTIPNIGAIVRYRSIFWIFIICPMLCNIDWKRFRFSQKTA